MMIPVSQLTYTYIYSYVSTFVVLPVTNFKIFLFIFLFFTLSLWCPFCPAQAVGLCDRLWIRPLWLPLEVWEPKRNFGTAVQKIVWKSGIESYCRLRHYVRDGCYLSCCCFAVLLDNILIIVNITYLQMLHSLKIFGKTPNESKLHS